METCFLCTVSNTGTGYRISIFGNEQFKIRYVLKNRFVYKLLFSCITQFCLASIKHTVFGMFLQISFVGRILLVTNVIRDSSAVLKKGLGNWGHLAEWVCSCRQGDCQRSQRSEAAQSGTAAGDQAAGAGARTAGQRQGGAAGRAAADQQQQQEGGWGGQKARTKADHSLHTPGAQARLSLLFSSLWNI